MENLRLGAQPEMPPKLCDLLVGQIFPEVQDDRELIDVSHNSESSTTGEELAVHARTSDRPVSPFKARASAETSLMRQGSRYPKLATIYVKRAAGTGPTALPWSVTSA